MNLRLFLTLALFPLFLESISQPSGLQIDSLLAKKITISGFCLCRNTLDDLKRNTSDLQQVDVENMDYGIRCNFPSSGPYEYPKGYTSSKYPGIVFQKDDQNYISKIRLTKDYLGMLPDGTPINMRTFSLRNILAVYPDIISQWASRDCSDYWKFSNDTLSFFVKIDKNKLPQFPIDEKYYLDKPIEGIDLVISCYALSHKTDEFVLFSPNEPMYFVDSTRYNQKALESMYQPTDFAFVSVYRGSNAIRIAGKEAKNGAIYMTTKLFARKHYLEYFKIKSTEYKKVVPDLETESKIVYILNDSVLKGDFEKDLFDIDDKIFIGLSIVSQEELKRDYNVSGKLIGVKITVKK